MLVCIEWSNGAVLVHMKLRSVSNARPLHLHCHNTRSMPVVLADARDFAWLRGLEACLTCAVPQVQALYFPRR